MFSASKEPTFSLYTKDGDRKYLDAAERKQFIASLDTHEQSVRLLCLVLVYTGCRLTEALNLAPKHILATDRAVVVRSLKKRQKTIYRHIPIPDKLTDDLIALSRRRPDRLFAWQRTQALHYVKDSMKAIGINDKRSNARCLRHTFGTHGARCGVPLTVLQRWMGHTKLETTAIYTQILGAEERELAKRMW